MTAPIDIAAEIRRAEALIGVGRYDDAIAALGRIVVVAPENTKALCLMAQCHGALNRHREMLKAADRAIATAPQSEWAFRLRSTGLRGLGQPRHAVEAARRAVALGPQVWATHVTLTDALLLIERREERREAYESAQRAIALAPEVPGTHNTMGRVFLSIGEHRIARVHFERAIGLDPTNSAAHTNLAITDLHKGRLAAASRRFSEVVANNPTVSSYVGNVNVAANAWIQRLLDYGWALLMVNVIVGVFEKLPLVAIGLNVVALGFAAWSFRRLTKPVRSVVRQKARDGDALAGALMLGGLLAFITYCLLTTVSGGEGSILIGPVLVWAGIAAMIRFNGRIRQRVSRMARRRKYSAFVLGDERKAMIPKQRSPRTD